MPDLDRLIFGVIRGLNAVHNCLGAIDCEVAMELNHGVCGINQVRFVPVDFGVVLSAYAGCRQDDRQQREREEAAARRPESTAARWAPILCGQNRARWSRRTSQLLSEHPVLYRVHAAWSTLTGSDKVITAPPPARSEILAMPP